MNPKGTIAWRIALGRFQNRKWNNDLPFLELESLADQALASPAEALVFELALRHLANVGLARKLQGRWHVTVPPQEPPDADDAKEYLRAMIRAAYRAEVAEFVEAFRSGRLSALWPNGAEIEPERWGCDERLDGPSLEPANVNLEGSTLDLAAVYVRSSDLSAWCDAYPPPGEGGQTVSQRCVAAILRTLEALGATVHGERWGFSGLLDSGAQPAAAAWDRPIDRPPPGKRELMQAALHRCLPQFPEGMPAPGGGALKDLYRHLHEAMKQLGWTGAAVDDRSWRRMLRRR